MSEVNEVFNDGRTSITNFDTSKAFIGDNRFVSADTENSTYDDITLKGGTVMGRISANQQIIPLKSGASDGSQFPVGILNTDHIIAPGETRSVSICVQGSVVEDKIVFDGSDTFDTVISGRSLRDRIAFDNAGIVLVESDELTDFDNQ